MAETTLNEILKRQFERSWKVVSEALQSFSPEEWTAGDVDYLTPARTAYHIVETAEFYSSDSPDGFPWGHRFGCDWEGAQPDELPAREEIIAYMAEVRAQVETWLNQDLLAEDPAFPWTGGTLLDRALYLVRHNHHHVGELWSEIKRRGHPLPDWW
jgi:hypothetical protein